MLCKYLWIYYKPSFSSSERDYTQQAELVHVKLGFVDTAETFSAVKGLIPVNIRDN